MINNRKALTTGDLWSLEEYSTRRPAFRALVLARKKVRRVHLGPNVTLQFEDELTIRYQIQEMLRIEKTFEHEGIQAELDAYNPLIPDGRNLKATMMIEYAEEHERRLALARLIGIEECVWLNCGSSKVMAIADEDLDRTTKDKTSAVHFLRFELPSQMAHCLKQGGTLSAGVSHRHYQVEIQIADEVSTELARDLD